LNCQLSINPLFLQRNTKDSLRFYLLFIHLEVYYDYFMEFSTLYEGWNSNSAIKVTSINNSVRFLPRIYVLVNTWSSVGSLCLDVVFLTSLSPEFWTWRMY